MGASKAQQAITAKRRSQALAMKVAGATYEKIATTLGYSSRAAACKDIQRALEEARKEQARDAGTLLAVELMRLDRLQAALWTGAIAGDHKVVDTVLKLMAHRARLLRLGELSTPTEGAKSLLGALADGLAAVAEGLPDDLGREPVPDAA